MISMKPRVGISSCLLGQPVRYDGGHKREPSIIEALGPLVEWVAVCPEIDIGLGVPRPPIDLRETPQGITLVMPETGRDLTEEMRAYAERKVVALAAMRLSGYVLKSKSPSCGLGSTKVYDELGTLVHREGTGIFAAVLKQKLPGLPVEEEAALVDPGRLRDFLERIRTYGSGRST